MDFQQILIFGLIGGVAGMIMGLLSLRRSKSRPPSDALSTPAEAYTSMVFSNTSQEVIQTLRQVTPQLKYTLDMEDLSQGLFVLGYAENVWSIAPASHWVICYVEEAPHGGTLLRIGVRAKDPQQKVALPIALRGARDKVLKAIYQPLQGNTQLP